MSKMAIIGSMGIEIWNVLQSVGLKWGDIDLFHWNTYESDYGHDQYFNVWTSTNKRIIGLLSATSVRRYIESTTTYLTLVQRLPLKLIAAYSGITPE